MPAITVASCLMSVIENLDRHHRTHSDPGRLAKRHFHSANCDDLVVSARIAHVCNTAYDCLHTCAADGAR